MHRADGEAMRQRIQPTMAYPVRTVRFNGADIDRYESAVKLVELSGVEVLLRVDRGQVFVKRVQRGKPGRETKLEGPSS